MDYKQLIDEVKYDLDNYSFSDSEYDKIYDAANSRIDENYRQSEAALERSYYDDRRRAAADNALDTKKLSEELAARGLANSGESAALRINQALSLNNSLYGLAQDNAKARGQLLSDYNEQKAAVEEKQAQFIADAAKAERDNLYDRLKHLEKLEAEGEMAALEDERWQAELAADKEKWMSELEADRKKWMSELEFDYYKTDAELAADKERWQSELDYDYYQTNAGIAADREKWQSELDYDYYKTNAELAADEKQWKAEIAHDRYITNKELAAEEEKWRAELANDSSQWRTELFYKIYTEKNGDGAEGGTTESGGAEETPAEEGLSPDVTVQTMANNIVNRYASSTGGLGSFSQDVVYSEFARLIATSDLNAEYAEQVLAALKSKGFKREFDIELAKKDYVKEGFIIYNTVFEEYYQGMLDDDATADEAYDAAHKEAVEAVEEHIENQNLDTETKNKVTKMYDFGAY